MCTTDLPNDHPIELRIDSIAFGGMGVARHHGQVVFVPYTAIGERVRARIEKRHRTFAVAKVTEVVAPSNSRREAPCRYYGSCGGCQLQHLTYTAQLEVKRGFVEESLRRIGGIKSPAVEPVVPSFCEWKYRHQAQMAVAREDQNVCVGFNSAGTHGVVDVAQCPILHTALSDVLRVFRCWVHQHPQSAFQPATHAGWLHGVEVRCNQDGSEVNACLRVRGVRHANMLALGEFLQKTIPSVSGVAFRMHPNAARGSPSRALTVIGRSFIYSTIGGIRLRVSVDSFAQANLMQSERLVDVAMGLADLQPGMVLLELYSGIGLFGLAATRKGARVYAIENCQCAVHDAQHNVANLSQNGCPANVTVMQTSAFRGMQILRARHIRPDVVVLDPPRGGANRQTLDEITKSRPLRIVYVSCNPTTLARDVKQLVGSGYQLVSAQPVDMFPQSYHVETVALLERTTAA